MLSRAGWAPPWAMIADDLTGACDASACFARSGFASTVLFDPAGPPAVDATLAVYSTFSRGDTPPEAVSKVEAACQAVAQTGRRFIFKKIDSTLKGHVREELEAAIRVGGFRTVLLSPAFPEMGRTVRGGTLFVNGVPLADLSGIVDGIPGVRVCDAETAAALRDLAEEALAEAEPPLLVGSAGLAGALAGALRVEFPAPLSAAALPEGRFGQLALFLGSTQPATLQQMEVLLRTVGGERAPAEPWSDSRECGVPGSLVVIRVDREGVDLDGIRWILDRLLQDGGIAGLVLSGGDTAHLVCRAAGAHGIQLGGEILRGIPWGVLSGGPLDGCPVCTKAGGFGKPDALVTAAGFLLGWKVHDAA